MHDRIARPASFRRHADYHRARKVHNCSPYCARQLTKKNPFGSAYQYDPANGRHHTVKFSHNDRNQHPRLLTLKSVIFVTAPCSRFPSVVSAAELTRFETDVRTIGEVSGATSYHSRMRQLRRSVTSPTPRLTVCQRAYPAHSTD